MPLHRESDIEFNFANNIWAVLKKVDDHIDYRKVEVLNGTKAVDFLGICNNDLTFIKILEDIGLQINLAWRKTVIS